MPINRAQFEITASVKTNPSDLAQLERLKSILRSMGLDESGNPIKLDPVPEDAKKHVEEFNVHGHEMHQLLRLLGHGAGEAGHALHFLFEPELLGVASLIIAVKALKEKFDELGESVKEFNEAEAKLDATRLEAHAQALRDARTAAVEYLGELGRLDAAYAASDEHLKNRVELVKQQLEAQEKIREAETQTAIARVETSNLPEDEKARRKGALEAADTSQKDAAEVAKQQADLAAKLEEKGKILDEFGVNKNANDPAALAEAEARARANDASRQDVHGALKAESSVATFRAGQVAAQKVGYEEVSDLTGRPSEKRATLDELNVAAKKKEDELRDLNRDAAKAESLGDKSYYKDQIARREYELQSMRDAQKQQQAAIDAANKAASNAAVKLSESDKNDAEAKKKEESNLDRLRHLGGNDGEISRLNKGIEIAQGQNSATELEKQKQDALKRIHAQQQANQDAAAAGKETWQQYGEQEEYAQGDKLQKQPQLDARRAWIDRQVQAAESKLQTARNHQDKQGAEAAIERLMELNGMLIALNEQFSAQLGRLDQKITAQSIQIQKLFNRK